MTIIKPHTNRSFKLYFIGVFLFLFVMGGVYIAEYNAVANLRFQVRDMKESMVKLQGENADLKDKVFSMNDPKKLQELAQEKGLFMDRKPQYMKVNQWVSDSSL